MACVRKFCQIPLNFLRPDRISVKYCQVYLSSASPKNDDNSKLNDEFNNENGTDTDLQEIKRDISRLPQFLACKMKHRLAITDEEKNVLHASTEDKLSYNRRLYAKYGKASGINPGIMWPSVEELQETIEDERELDKTLSDMIITLEKQKKDQLKAMLEKDKLVEKRMKEMPKLIEKYRHHLQDIKAEEERGRQRHHKLLEEAREFFGYEISSRDAQFKAYEENRKEEEAKLLKKQKKELKIALRKQRHAITGEDKNTEKISEQVEQ